MRIVQAHVPMYVYVTKSVMVRTDPFTYAVARIVTHETFMRLRWTSKNTLYCVMLCGRAWVCKLGPDREWCA